MDFAQERRMRENWRGRRYLACEAVNSLYGIIEALGVEDGSELPPSDSTAVPVTPALTAEMQNMATCLLRLILLHNDGNVGPAKLQRF